MSVQFPNGKGGGQGNKKGEYATGSKSLDRPV